MNKVVKGIGLYLYGTLVFFFALAALGMSFLSDGPVPLSVHILFPLMVLIIFAAPVIIWRRLNAGPIPSPLPAKLRKHQDVIIVGFLAIWATYLGVEYLAGRSN
jgi:hypothetical protein